MRLLAVATLALVVSLPARARADDTRASAAASFREAQAAFARRDYAAAAAAFEVTAKIAPHPATWLNAAEAWELRGDPARAAEDCDRALETPNGTPEIRAEAEKRLAHVARRVLTVDVRGPRSKGVRIDDDAVRPLPVLRRLAPGRHRLVLVDLATNAEEERELDGAAGEVRRIEIPEVGPAPAPAPVAEAAPARAAPRAAGSGPPLGSWIAFGAGAAFAVGAGVMGGITLGAKSTYERDPTKGTLDAFKTDRLVTNVLVSGAVVAVAAGAVLWLVAPRAAAASARSPLGPLVVF